MATVPSLSPIPEPANEGIGEAVEIVESASGFEDGEMDACEAPDRSLENGLQPERPLEEGACVCFFTPRGQLMVVRPNGRFWELHPITVGHTSYDADGNQRLVFYPPEATFTVMKRGRHVGFSSLAAEGRTLQAVRGDEAPHRINNHNFGDWESWEQGAEGLTNVKWGKKLGLEIKEIRSVAVQDLKGAQRSHLRSIRVMQKKVQASDARIAEAERRVKEALRSSQRQQTLHQKELAHVRGRLEAALKSQQKRELESMQSGAVFKDTELRFSKILAEKDALESAASQEKQRYEALQREMQLIRERHDGEMHRLELAHSSEINALTREKDLEVKHVKQQYDEQLSKLRVELGSRAQMKDSRISELEGTLGGTMREKDMQIAELIEECNRLHLALKAIKSQVEQAHIAKVSLEAGSASLSPVVSPPAVRVSPVLRSMSRGPSRASSRRSGRSSADPVLCMNPAASPVPVTPQGAARFRDGPVIDRSGARAPTPTSPGSLFASRTTSPFSSLSDRNPPAGGDTDQSDEGQQIAMNEPSLSMGFPSSEAEAELKSRQQTLLARKGAHDDLTFSRRSSDGYESDNSFQSASEEVEGLEGARRVKRSTSFSELQEGVREMAGGPSGKALAPLRSFPINNAENSC